MEDKDPKIKLQFWTRQSQYKRMLRVCPNTGDRSELMREGLEMALLIREERLARLKALGTEENSQNQEQKAS